MDELETETAKNTPGKSGKLRMEDMSKEDLIQQIRKHFVLLHKLKSKCDDYSEKFQCLEKKYEESVRRNDEQEGKVQVLSTENDSLRKTLLTTSEDIECMKMKEKTMAAGFQSVLEEVSSTRDEKEKLAKQIVLLTKAREEAVSSLKAVTANLKHEMEEDRKRHKEEISSVMSQNTILLDSNSALQAQLVSSKSEWESILNEKKCNEELRKELETARDIVAKIQHEHEENLKELAIAHVHLADLQVKIQSYSVAKNDIEIDCHIDHDGDNSNEEMNELQICVQNLTEELELANTDRYNLQLGEKELKSELHMTNEQCEKFKVLLGIVANQLEDDTFLNMGNSDAHNHLNSLLKSKIYLTENANVFLEHERRVKNMLANLETYGCVPKLDHMNDINFAGLMEKLDESITKTLHNKISELDETHRMKCESLNGTMQELLESYECKTEHCLQLENSIGVLSERLLSLEDYCFPSCSIGITQTDEQIPDTDEVIKLMSEENAALLERMMQMEQILEQLRVENETLSQERFKYSEMYIELKEISAATSEVSNKGNKHVQTELNRQICDKCVTNSYREKELEGKDRLMESILVKCQEKLQIFKSIASRVKEETVGMEAQIANLVDQIDRLTDENNKSQNALAQLRDEYAVHINQLKNLQSDYKLMEDNLEEQKRLYDSCHQKFLKASSECGAMQLQICGLKEENETLSRRIVMTESEKESRHQNVISLEIEDYERLVKDLNEKLKDQDQEIKSLKLELQIRVDREGELKKQIADMENQKTQTSERADKLKVLLIKCKRELAESVKVTKNQQAVHEELQSKYEVMQREMESYKVQTSDLASELQATREKARIASESNNRTTARLESKISLLQEKITAIQLDYETCQAEYNSYKVRVHSVLKQQKSNQSPSTDGSHLDDTSEKERLEKLVQHLQLNVQEMMNKLDEANADREANGELHDRLLQRYNKLVQQIEANELTWKEKLDHLCLEKDTALKESQKLVKLLQNQVDSLNASCMDKMNQIRISQDALSDFRHQLEMSKAENTKLLQERCVLQRDEEILIVANMERQEGEGSEMTVDSDLHHSMANSLSTFVPLEQLIDPDGNPDDGISNSSASVADISKLENQLGHATKKIDHLAEVLHESEATNARLSEQARVLKEEIRRLERNQERERHAANMEYLKNVIVKFFSLQAGSEREQLVSVLKTMLRFSRQEEEMMLLAAKGSSVVQSHSSSSWSSYLPAWSNLV